MKTYFLCACLLGAGFATQANESLPTWPRSFNNADGSTTTIQQAPKRILSTSVTVTGTLLAMDAPLIASASAANGEFFAQWAQNAAAKKVVNVWPAGSVDLESAYLQQPDLIIVSKSGADSAADQLAQLRLVAPTIVVDYSIQTWQSLAKRLSTALGRETTTEKLVADFDAYVAATRQQLDLPSGKTNIISYHGAGVINAIAKPEGAHSRLLSELGFKMETPLETWQVGSASHRDFLRVHYESLTGLKAETTFLLNADDSKAPRFLNDPVLKNLPSIKLKQVYGLGANSFRMDWFSAREVVDMVGQRFAVDWQEQQ